MSSDKIKYTVKYDKRFFTKLIFFEYYNRPLIVILTLGGVLAFLLTLGYWFSWNPFGFKSFPLFFLTYFVSVVLLPFFIWYKISKNMVDNPLLGIPIHFEITEDEIQINYNRSSKVIRWHQLHHMSSHPSAWLLYGTAHSLFYMPKSDFSEEQKGYYSTGLN